MLGSILGGIAGSVVSGLFGKERDSDSQEFATQRSEQEYQRQKEFAQMGIRWKAEDAKAAGLHPLAAIGGVGASYSPTLVMPDRSPMPDFAGTGEKIGSYLEQMGQNTARAQNATATVEERRLAELAIRNAELRNSSLELDLAAKTAALLGQPSNPPLPSAAGPSVVSSGHTLSAVGRGIKVEPSTSVVASPANTGLEAASTPFAKRHNLGRGLGVMLPSQAAAEALEGLGAAQHVAGPALLGAIAAGQLLHGPETGPPHPSMKWNRWKQAWEYTPPSKKSWWDSSTRGAYPAPAYRRDR